MTVALIKQGNLDTETDTEKDVKTQRGWTDASLSLGYQRPGQKPGQTLPQSRLREPGPAHTLILDSRTVREYVSIYEIDIHPVCDALLGQRQIYLLKPHILNQGQKNEGWNLSLVLRGMFV